MGGITPAELAAIGDRLEGFADDVFASLPRTDQRVRERCYLRGLLLEGRRKSIEPMAARLGGEVHYQALHHFVAVSPWDWRPVRRRLAERLAGRWSRWHGWWTTPASPRTASIRWGSSASTWARWASGPTASWGCRSTRSPSTLPARWTGGCLCPKAGTSPPWPPGAPPATCPLLFIIGPSGSWWWTCSMSLANGSSVRRCLWPTAAMGRWGRSAQGWTCARSPMS
jgi:DDE superfamily endonuclease